jgi:hypothetical protein
VEWMKKIMSKVWKNVNNYDKKLIEEKIENNVSESMEE